MAVETLSEFPGSFIAGDTIRVTIGDSRFPSTLWTLKVHLQGPNGFYSFSTSAGPSTSFTLLISTTNSAKIAAGSYTVFYVYTETSSNERQTDEVTLQTQVYQNPSAPGAKSIARQTLEAMEAAFLKLSKNPKLTVSFVGESFTNKNLKEFQDAIDRQRALVAAEEGNIQGSGRGGKVFHPL